MRATSPTLQEAAHPSGQIAECNIASDAAPPKEGTLAWILAQGARSEGRVLHCQGGCSLEELEADLRLPVALSRDDMLSLRTELAKGVILMRYGSRWGRLPAGSPDFETPTHPALTIPPLCSTPRLQDCAFNEDNEWVKEPSGA